jgi:hypothetical protein
MAAPDLLLLNWNVHGLNAPIKCHAVKDMVATVKVSHSVFKAKTRCSSYVCPGSSCHTYGQNVSTEYQCLYYIVSYYKNYYKSRKD